ncbi:hypothetical protein OG978_03555 [Streptomyces sp. NBC_01591]|uniref:hypothetical protein n=1 Tax=Streptomyces sp. NBC_01591 TaxID=2975888 RepID=UPI002DD7FE48|nr:hypothetical protein [Streptomyces sp. NBC_01591]WSD66539.1 hypothetical protein OG978_03555 [Streptomyces sp. NBC_01591]
MTREPEAGLLRLAAALTEHLGHDIHADDADPRLIWTDGPTVTQIRHAAGARESGEFRCLRRLSENAIALGAIRIATTQAPDGRTRPRITPSTVEEYWHETPLPSPATDREQALVYAAIYQIRDDHHRNTARSGEICDLVASGLAPLARRAGVPLAPAETLTAHYATGPARRAWHHALTPMPALDAVLAVQADPRAKPEHITAALTVVSELPADTGTAVTELTARLHTPGRWQPPRPNGQP